MEELVGVHVTIESIQTDLISLLSRVSEVKRRTHGVLERFDQGEFQAKQVKEPSNSENPTTQPRKPILTINSLRNEIGNEIEAIDDCLGKIEEWIGFEEEKKSSL